MVRGREAFWRLLVVTVTNLPNYDINRCKSAICDFLSQNTKSARDKNETRFYYEFVRTYSQIYCLIFLLILKSHPHILEVDNKFPVRH